MSDCVVCDDPGPQARKLPDLPFATADWAALSRRMQLPPQQALLVELILRGMRDKEIAAEMRLSASTVRTYLNRIFHRLGVSTRMELVLRIFAESHRGRERAGVDRP